MRSAAAAARAFIAGLAGWLFIAPFALLAPRRGDWVCVIGRDDGRFVDNAKYFFIESGALLPAGVRVEFLTERRPLAEELARSGRPALHYPSAKAIYFLLRCRTVVMDSNEWRNGLRRFLLVGARKFQSWHGVGFKRIEADKWRNEVAARRWLSRGPWPFLRRAWRVFTGREAPYDAVLATSEFYRREVFAPAFWTREVVVGGYPRNTFGRGLDAASQALVRLGTDEAIMDKAEAWAASGRRIVLVAPTFRDTRASPLGLTPSVVRELDDFAAIEGYEFVFKFHPHERGATHVAGKHLHVASAEADIYPLLPLTAALVTDYSSIYMDYLLLDRPVLFVAMDRDDYVSLDRQLQFDYDAMTPGPKLGDWRDVMATLRGGDEWADERRRLRKLAFDDLDPAESTRRIVDHLLRMRWIEPRTTS